MNKIKKGDIVGRKSYKKDILFVVDRIIKSKNKTDVAILKGMTLRIEADAYIDDLEIIEKECIDRSLINLDNRLEDRIKKHFLKNIVDTNKLKRKLLGRETDQYITGKILHLDGDKRYSEKSARYYKKMGLNAIVKSIPENKQPLYIQELLKKYNPDILIITRT